MEEITYLNMIFAGAGALAGVLLTSILFLLARQKLHTQNAEFKAQIKAEKAALDTAGAALDQRFKATAYEALQQSSTQFLNLAQERMNNTQQRSAHDLEKRQEAIDALVKPVAENLKNLSSAIEQVKGTDRELRQDLKNLSQETARLVGALRDPAAQGQWGEFILEGLLDKSGLIKGVHYKTQMTLEAKNGETQSGRHRPDAVIHMQDGFNIIIDSKAPLNEFSQRLSEELSETDYQDLMKKLARQVREHVKALGRKDYWESIESPDFTVMFLPSEHIYSIALRSDPTLVDFAASQNVIIASPTLLMSLLRVVSMSWRQVTLAQNAQEISERGIDLYKRFLKFTDHLEKIGKNLQGAMSGYDSAVGTLEKQILPAARKFKDLQGIENAGKIGNLPEFKDIELPPRALNLIPEDEQEKKRA